MKKKTRIEERNTQETVFSILTQPIDLFYYILSGHSTSISHHRQGSRIAITTRDWMRRGCVGAAPDRILSRAGQMVPSQLEEPHGPSSECHWALTAREGFKGVTGASGVAAVEVGGSESIISLGEAWHYSKTSCLLVSALDSFKLLRS